ncbi:MAG: ribosome-binding factor A [Actinobacteria bacterium]|nr:MAG: ribosome-binding factor A [Actinomycetota bacterium]
MTARRQPRRFPRMLRVNELVHETLADELERMSDPRLELVTITGVDVSPDLRHATVYYAPPRLRPTRRRRHEPAQPADAPTRDSTQAALRAAAPHLRAALGRQVRMKYLPELRFREDPAIAQGERVDDIIRNLHAHEGVVSWLDQAQDPENL